MNSFVTAEMTRDSEFEEKLIIGVTKMHHHAVLTWAFVEEWRTVTPLSNGLLDRCNKESRGNCFHNSARNGTTHECVYSSTVAQSVACSDTTLRTAGSTNSLNVMKFNNLFEIWLFFLMARKTGPHVSFLHKQEKK
jgi:hypothetical protein